MRVNYQTRAALVAVLAALLFGCEVDEAFVPGGGGGGFRIVWPATTSAVDDDSTYAIAIFPFANTESVTFTAELDGNGIGIGGLRNESDSLVAFPLSGLTNGQHSIQVQASTGDLRERTFTVSLVARPTITNVDPDSGTANASQIITISGSGFLTNSQQVRVYLNGVQLPIVGVPMPSQVAATLQGTGLRSGLLSVANEPTAATRRISRGLIPFRVVNESSTLPGQAEIFLADPNTASKGAPVLLHGQGFSTGDIPSFGISRSSPVLIVGSRTLGNDVGPVQFGLSFVPPFAPSQNSVVTIEAGGTTSTSFPFFIR